MTIGSCEGDAKGNVSSSCSSGNVIAATDAFREQQANAAQNPLERAADAVGQAFGKVGESLGKASDDLAETGIYLAKTADDIIGSVRDIAERVHGNSDKSLRSTEVYTLINRKTGAIDKIGVTSLGQRGRYSDAYLRNEGVTYRTIQEFNTRRPAKVSENILLVHYRLNHFGTLPRLNRTTN